MEYYDQIWQAIIRPPRANYRLKDMGPREFIVSSGMRVLRTDIDLPNPKGHVMKCSHFEPMESARQWKQMPCVIYMHGNSSCRLEALELVDYFLTSNITLFCFDFPGCGLSEGEFISLGWFERDDTATIVEHLRTHRNVSTIGLWGRSMGAVTALLHGDRDPSIGGMVLDSPFSNLRTLCDELAASHSKVPKFLVGAAMSFITKTIRKKADFDLNKLTPITHVKECFIPALFATGEQDEFIKPHHTQELHDAYAGDKNLIKFSGDHNSSRPDFFNNSAVIFFVNTLQVHFLLTEETKMSEEERAVFKQKLAERRERERKSKSEDSKQDGGPQSDNSGPARPNIDEPPATGLEAMMGLDNMGEMEIPDMFSAAGGGQGGLTEEEMIAQAIQASLQDMSLNDGTNQQNPQQQQNSGAPGQAQESNEISQESYNFLSEFAGMQPQQHSQAAQPQVKDPFAEDPFSKDPFDVQESGVEEVKHAVQPNNPFAAQPPQMPPQPQQQQNFSVPAYPDLGTNNQQSFTGDNAAAGSGIGNASVQVAHDLIDISAPQREKSAFETEEDQ